MLKIFIVLFLLVIYPTGLIQAAESPNKSNAKAPQIISKSKPSYTLEAKNRKIEGVVVLQAVFRKDGTVGDIKVMRSLGFGLDEEAVKAAQKIVFVPAERDGKPVNVRARLEFTFNLL